MPPQAIALAAYLRELAFAGTTPAEETRLLLLDAACAIEAGRSELAQLARLVNAELVEPFASRVRECVVPAVRLRVVSEGEEVMPVCPLVRVPGVAWRHVSGGATSSAARSDGEPATAPHIAGGAQSAGEPSPVRPLREAAGRQPLSASLPGLAGEIQLAKEGA